jgi:pyrimidine-specific ribonucleoside hydrolase
MKRLYLIFTVLFLSLSLYSHPWKPSHYVIVDTDGGIDDIKAITMLLASPDVRVLAITVSPGALSAENAYIKVKSLLNSYFHEGIPVGINRISNVTSAELPFALETKWGNEDGINAKEAPDFIPVISEIISAEKTKISFICLGSMSTALHALRDIPEFGKQVKDFIWSADGPDDKAGFNYNIDKKSSIAILKQEIPVKIVRNYTISDNDFYNDGLLNLLGSVKTVYAKKLSAFFSSDAAKNHKFSYAAADELTAIFLHYPELFINKTLGNISDCIPSDLTGLRESAIRILKGETVPKNQVIKEFPTDPSFYFDDLKSSVTDIIDKYGMDEWSSGVLANELHRHLGVFAIIGVKMGIRAREYFDTGVDEFRATSFAGSVPPLSCFNDGLQVSTGATPGHGLLTVRNDPPASPSAEFTYMNRKIRLTLKPELSEKIYSELKEINFVYGLDSNTYWELVRKNSIKYWLNLDRHEIFEIEEVVHPPTPPRI